MSDKKKHEKHRYLGLSVGYGLIAGSGVGVLAIGLFSGIEAVMNFAIPIGASIGMLVGTVIGSLMDAKNKKE